MGYRSDLCDGGKAEIVSAKEFIYYSGLGRIEHYLNTFGTLCRKDEFAMHFQCDDNCFTISPVKSCMRRILSKPQSAESLNMKAQMVAVAMLLFEKHFVTLESIDIATKESPLTYLLSVDQSLLNNRDLFPVYMRDEHSERVVLARSSQVTRIYDGMPVIKFRSF